MLFHRANHLASRLGRDAEFSRSTTPLLGAWGAMLPVEKAVFQACRSSDPIPNTIHPHLSLHTCFCSFADPPPASRPPPFHMCRTQRPRSLAPACVCALDWPDRVFRSIPRWLHGWQGLLRSRRLPSWRPLVDASRRPVQCSPRVNVQVQPPSPVNVRWERCFHRISRRSGSSAAQACPVATRRSVCLR